MRQEAQRHGAGLVQADREVGPRDHEEREQSARQTGRQAVPHAAMHRITLEDLGRAKADCGVNAGTDDSHRFMRPT